MSNWANASYVIIKGNNADDCLSGTVTYVWNPSSLMYDPTLVEYLKFENKSGGVKVTNLDLNGTNYVLIFRTSVLAKRTKVSLACGATRNSWQI